MQRIALFVEGLTEAVFIKTLLLSVLKPDQVNINFIALGPPSTKSPYDHEIPYAVLSVLVIDVGGDEQVLSSIREREEKLIKEGYSKIMGLQDLRSHEYDKLSGGKIVQAITDKFISERQKAINRMSDPRKIKSFFSIMEIEAWLLSLHRVIYRIDKNLTKAGVRNICKKGKNLENLDPEVEFYNPSSILQAIYVSVSKKYNKSLSCSHSLMSKIQKSDIDELQSSGKCSAFRDFYRELFKGYESL